MLAPIIDYQSRKGLIILSQPDTGWGFALFVGISVKLI